MKRWFLSGLALAAVLAVAACGADGGAAADGGTGEGANAFSAYRDCLAQQGIDLPEQVTARPSGFPSGRPTAFPSGRPSGFPSGRPTAFPSGRQGGGFAGMRPEGVDDETWQKAQTACASVMPTGGPGGFGGNQGGGNRGGGDRAADAAYRNCLADHGVTTDPATTAADPKTAAAVEACAVLRPAATGSPTP